MVQSLSCTDERRAAALAIVRAHRCIGQPAPHGSSGTVQPPTGHWYRCGQHALCSYGSEYVCWPSPRRKELPRCCQDDTDLEVGCDEITALSSLVSVVEAVWRLVGDRRYNCVHRSMSQHHLACICDLGHYTSPSVLAVSSIVHPAYDKTRRDGWQRCQQCSTDGEQGGTSPA